MRKRIDIGPSIGFDPVALLDEPVFLYRRLGDADRAVLGIGVLSSHQEPPPSGEGGVADWCFGHVCYELKEELHGLRRPRAEGTGFPVSSWFVPKWVVEWNEGRATLHVHSADEDQGVALAQRVNALPNHAGPIEPLTWERKTTRERYMDRTARLMERIQRGDLYEVNYCTERTATDGSFDPFAGFARLLASSDAPFAAFYRSNERFALCASPERFLAFDGDRVVGEPMKGTRPRGRSLAEDEHLRDQLANDPKERSENVMAVDVMRNDLSQVAEPGSVAVSELCAVRSYPRVHQLVSTITAIKATGVGPFQVVRAAFPMASMTGAPKRSAMRSIDELEDQPRGLYSGTLGFFSPSGLADLNVVIRTVLFDRATGVLSLSTGSALTAQCDPVEEWEECELKARSVLMALGA